MSGAWSTPGNWTNGVPSSSCGAVISVAGTYTVTIAGQSVEAQSLTLGGSSGTQTLLVQATDDCSNALDAQLLLLASSAVSANGKVELTQSGSCGGGKPSLNVAATLTNSGTIQTDLGAHATAGAHSPGLGGAIVNTGTINVNTSSVFYATYYFETYLASLDNKGSINVANGAIFTNQATVTDDTGGSISNGGGTGYLYTIYSSGYYVQGNGTTSPSTLNPSNPAVVIDVNGTVQFAGSAGAGASSVVVRGEDKLTGTSSPGQNLTIQGYDDCTTSDPGSLNVPANTTNGGTVQLIETGACSGDAAPRLNVASGVTLTNKGLLRVDPGPHQTTTNLPAVTGSGTYLNKGTIEYNTSTGAGLMTLDNQGTVSLAAGVTVEVSQGTVTDDTGGLITNGKGNGNLFIYYGTFNQGAGTNNQTAVVPKKPAVTVAYNSHLNYTGAGKGTLLIHGGVTETGNISKGQNVVLEGECRYGDELDARLEAAASFTNAGKITFTHLAEPTGDCGEDAIVIELPSGDTLTNTGTLSAITGGGNPESLREINGNLINKGTISCNGVGLKVTGSTTNETVRLTLTPSSSTAGSSFTAEGSGFSPGATVAITFGKTKLVSATANSSGSFSQTETVPSLKTGTYTVKASAQKVTAETSFTLK